MKKTPVLLAVIVLLACTPKKTVDQNATATEEASIQPGCYRWSDGKSSVKLTLKLDGNTASGNLDYNLAEKDSNRGTISGTIAGNTLTAFYTFTSEGVSSVREITFALRDGKLIEGTGERHDQGDTSTYVNGAALHFDDNTIALSPGCD